jgi:hypothetical protein
MATSKKTVTTWAEAETLARALERDGYRILAMSDERSGVRVTWTENDSESSPDTH